MKTNRLENVFCRCCQRVTQADRDAAGVELCDVCYEFASHENWHSDESHEPKTPVLGCQICKGMSCHETVRHVSTRPDW